MASHFIRGASRAVLLNRLSGWRRAGFTLLELLAVCLIVGLLAALLLPAMSRAKASAHRVACGSNMRQIAVAITLYADDFRNYPVLCQRVAADGSDSRSCWWDHQLLSQARFSRKLFLCPANKAVLQDADRNWNYIPRLAAWSDYFGGFDQMPETWPNASYGYNTLGAAFRPMSSVCLGLGGVRRSRRAEWSGLPASRVVVPSDMIAVAEWDPRLTDEDGDQDLHPAFLFPVALGTRHMAGSNALFCDGHIQYNPTSRWAPKTLGAVRRWNWDHKADPSEH